MRLYEVKVLVDTDESNEWRKVSEHGDICPRGLLATRPMLLNIEYITCVFPDKDRRVTMCYFSGDESCLIAMPYEDFKSMILNQESILSA